MPLTPGWRRFAAMALMAASVFGSHSSLSAEMAPQVTRGPYLQMGTSSNIVVRWRTDLLTDTRVQFGTRSTALNRTASDPVLTTEHEIVLQNLTPYTKYFYAVGTSQTNLAGDESYFFYSAPIPGTVQPVRFWAIGDFGTGYQYQYEVRDRYAELTGSGHTDLWLMLGDNAYGQGLDDEYQWFVFDIYNTLLRQSVVWPTMGNHDAAFIEDLSDDYPYYSIFTMPTNGEAGGVASGSEHYYSYDYANIHFICLDSQTSIFRQNNSAMCNWLKADLAETTRDWIVAYFHHPPYSHGSHNSDYEPELLEMRENVVPILENWGVDLVLSGHSHNYERSHLIDGFYQVSSQASPTNYINLDGGKTNAGGAYIKPSGGLGARRGAVYVTDGSSGGAGGAGNLDHPAMYYSTYDSGSVVVDIVGQRLDAKFLRWDGEITDYFTIDKSGVATNLPALNIAKAGPNAVVTWPTSLPDYRLESALRLTNGASWDTVGPVMTNGRMKSVSVPASAPSQFFRLRQHP